MPVTTSISPAHYHEPYIARMPDGRVVASIGDDQWRLNCHSYADVNRLVAAVLELRDAWQETAGTEASPINDAMADDARTDVNGGAA